MTVGVIGLAAAVMAAGCGGGGAARAGGAPAAGVGVATRDAAATRAAPVSEDGRIARECVRAARHAGFAIACPVGLPRDATSFWANGFGGSECGPVRASRRMRRWTWVGADFSVAGSLRHLVIASAPRRVSARAFVYSVGTSRPYRSPRVTVAATTTIGGRRAEYVRPSPNPNLPAADGTFIGRTVLLWSVHGRTYAIGVTGRRPHARRVEAAEARRLVFVRPP